MTAETWSFWQPMSLIKSLQDTQFNILQVRKTITFLSGQVLVIVISEFYSLVISLQHLDYRLAADWRFIDNKLTTTSKVTTKDNSTQNTLYMSFFMEYRVTKLSSWTSLCQHSAHLWNFLSFQQYMTMFTLEFTTRNRWER